MSCFLLPLKNKNLHPDYIGQGRKEQKPKIHKNMHRVFFNEKSLQLGASHKSLIISSHLWKHDS